MAKLPALIEALLDPQAYLTPPQKIELVQTQMSFVFLADDYVYKIKKPVNLGYLDYSTLGKRQFYCQKEVELNRRLSPDVYLSVVPIVKRNGDIFIENNGEVMEYAVKMRRLPHNLMMDALLVKNKVSPQMVTDVAEKLAAFHRMAETSDSISAFGNLDTVIQNTEENFTQTGKYIGVIISPEAYQAIKAYSNSFIKDNTLLFQKRVIDGKIKDCHGDLHALHICFFNGISIYDCIEFNDRFRYCDVASEVAFLAMDLDHYGRVDLSDCFVNAYIEESREKGMKQLLGFYKCYRAYVRSKVACFKYDDPYISTEERERELASAQSYFKLAESYTQAD